MPNPLSLQPLSVRSAWGFGAHLSSEEPSCWGGSVGCWSWKTCLMSKCCPTSQLHWRMCKMVWVKYGPLEGSLAQQPQEVEIGVRWRYHSSIPSCMRTWIRMCQLFHNFYKFTDFTGWLAFQTCFWVEDLLAPPLLRSLLQLLVGNRIELDTFSFIESQPGSLDQPWHFDVPLPDFGLKGLAPSAAWLQGGWLTKWGCVGLWVSMDEKMSKVGLVSVVPLVDVMPTNGATEFLPGSHYQTADRRYWIDAETRSSVLHLQPSLAVGSLALFDLGLRHRGTANSAQRSRTILYMSYVHEWFRDAINFPEPQSSTWHSWAPTAKRLLSRLDSRRYLQELERKVGVVSHSDGHRRKDLEL